MAGDQLRQNLHHSGRLKPAEVGKALYRMPRVDKRVGTPQRIRSVNHLRTLSLRLSAKNFAFLLCLSNERGNVLIYGLHQIDLILESEKRMGAYLRLNNFKVC